MKRSAIFEEKYFMKFCEFWASYRKWDPQRALCTIFTILLTLWNSELKNGLLIKLFCFLSDLDETWRSCSYPYVVQFHQVSSKSDEKQKSFLNSPFFCSEIQSVSRIVKIVHSSTQVLLVLLLFKKIQLEKTFHFFEF